MAVSANERQVGGQHYKNQSRSGQEHWDMAWDFRLDFFQYQITKYVMRHQGKNGTQDLHKARHFLDKYIELLEKECGPKPGGIAPYPAGNPEASYGRDELGSPVKRY